MTLGLVAQRGNERAVALVEEIRMTVGADAVLVDTETATALDVAGTAVGEIDEADLVVSIGGDGTFLFVARHLSETPIMGVNLGEVGFLTAVAPEDAVAEVRERYAEALVGDLATRERARIGAHGDGWSLAPALNEVMIHAPQRGPGRRIDLSVTVDGARYERGRMDGAMVATPSGSTAYNLSEHGPLVMPEVAGLVVNDMSAAAGAPPLVVAPDAVVDIAVEGKEQAVVIADGRTSQEVDGPARIRIERVDPPLRLAGPAVPFFDALERLA